MKKVTLLSLSLLLSLMQIFAQETTSTKKETSYAVNRIGLITGLGLSKGRFVNESYDNYNNELKTLTTGSAMFFWEKGKNEHFITQVGLGYAGKGFKMDGGKLYLHYIELPIIMNLRMNIAGPVYLMAGFGPNFSAAFAGSLKSDASEGESATTDRDILEYQIGINSQKARPFNPVDIGLIFNGCVEVNLPEGKTVEVGVNYKLGFNKISNTSTYWATSDDGSTDNPGYKTGVLTFTLAYLFDRNKK